MLAASAARKVLGFGLAALAQSALAAYGGSLLEYLAALAIVLLPGNHRWIDAILISPTFLLPIGAGALLAYVLRNHLSRSSYFAWTIPAVLFYRASLEVMRSSGASTSDTWDNLIGQNCQGSECLYEALFTLPLVCGLSYSIASACIRTIKTSLAPTDEDTAT